MKYLFPIIQLSFQLSASGYYVWSGGWRLATVWICSSIITIMFFFGGIVE